MDINRGFVNLNDQYKLNTSKGKRGAQNTQTISSMAVKTTNTKYRSNSQGLNDK